MMNFGGRDWELFVILSKMLVTSNPRVMCSDAYRMTF
jgi:hypothetical protein